MIERARAHARRRAERGKKECFLRQPCLGLLLSEQFELRLGVGKILPSKIGLGQFHPYLRGETGIRVLLEKLVRRCDDGCFVGRLS